MTNPKVELIDIDKLIPYINNARTHSEEQVAQIAASIKEFGFNNPVLIDGEDSIIAGHGRVMAARKLELSKVPVIRLAHLTEQQKKAYILADNKLALNAGWDEDLLKLEIEGLDPNMVQFTGFSQDEINLMFNGWDSDIERMDGIEPKDTTAREKIIISCDGSVKAELYEKITNLIDSLGLEDVEVS